MNNRLAPLVCVGLAAALLPEQTHGVGFRIPNQDPQAIGRGNAFTATADNPSAIYYNPAGISQLKGINAQVGLYATAVKSHFENPAGLQFETQSEWQFVPQTHITAEIKDTPFTVGLGVYVPYGLGLEWPESTGFRNVAREGRLQYATVTPVLSWEVIPGLSIAAGPTINRAEVTLRQGISPVPYSDEFEFAGRDYDFGFHAGLLWQPCKQFSFGVNYKSETRMDFHGHSIAAPYAPAETTYARVPFPQFVMVGASYRPTTNWNFEVNVDWTDWDVLDTVTFRKPSGPTHVPFNWQSSMFYCFGATRQLTHGYYISLGYFFSENSTTDADFNPIVPDTDLHVGSIGFGKKKEKYSWAIAYQLITGPARTITSPAVIAGDYNFLNHGLSASIGFHF